MKNYFGKLWSVLGFLLFIGFFVGLGFGIYESGKIDPKDIYLSEWVTVVGKFPPTMQQSGKYSVEVKKILIRRDEDTTMYAELGSDDWNTFRLSHMNYNERRRTYFDSLYYNTPVGGKLYFKYIGKYRFFHITNFKQ